MQPVELLVVTDPDSAQAIRRIVDDYKNSRLLRPRGDAGGVAGLAVDRRDARPLGLPDGAASSIAVLGDTRRRVGLPMAARYATQKGDSIFESSLANAFLYLLAGRAQPRARGPARLRRSSTPPSRAW